MPSNDSEHGSKVYADYENALFRMLMHEVAAEEGKEMQVTREVLKSLPESKPPESALQKFTEQLDAQLSKQQAVSRRRKLSRMLSRVAVAVFALLFVFFTAMTTVQAFRVKVMNIWMEIQPEFTIFRLKEKDPGTVGPVVNWTNAYVPTYLPQGYEVTSSSITEYRREIVLEREGLYIIYMELDELSGPAIDTEKASRVESVQISGHDGTLVQKNGLTTVVWEMDGRLFIVQAWENMDIGLKVANGVQFVK